MNIGHPFAWKWVSGDYDQIWRHRWQTRWEWWDCTCRHTSRSSHHFEVPARKDWWHSSPKLEAKIHSMLCAVVLPTQSVDLPMWQINSTFFFSFVFLPLIKLNFDKEDKPISTHCQEIGNGRKWRILAVVGSNPGWGFFFIFFCFFFNY